MTMMTPMGRGGRMYPRSRRWPRVLAVFLIVGLIGGAGGVAAWWWFTQHESTAADAQTTPTRLCHTPTAKPPKAIPPARQVMVDVANGTDEQGLAVKTADTLTSRGFQVLSIGNAAQPVKNGTAVVRYANAQFGEAIRVASFAPGAELTMVENLRGGRVQLWIGPDFRGIVSTSDADVDEVQLPTGKPNCKPN